MYTTVANSTLEANFAPIFVTLGAWLLFRQRVYGFAHLPAAFSSVSLLLQPVLAAIYAWALLGEAVGPAQMLGGLVVLAGIYLARRGS